MFSLAVRVYFHNTKYESCEINYFYTSDYGFYELRLYFHMHVYSSQQIFNTKGFYWIYIIKWLSGFYVVLRWFRVCECLSESHQG